MFSPINQFIGIVLQTSNQIRVIERAWCVFVDYSVSYNWWNLRMNSPTDGNCLKRITNIATGLTKINWIKVFQRLSINLFVVVSIFLKLKSVGNFYHQRLQLGHRWLREFTFFLHMFIPNNWSLYFFIFILLSIHFYFL